MLEKAHPHPLHVSWSGVPAELLSNGTVNMNFTDDLVTAYAQAIAKNIDFSAVRLAQPTVAAFYWRGSMRYGAI